MIGRKRNRRKDSRRERTYEKRQGFKNPKMRPFSVREATA